MQAAFKGAIEELHKVLALHELDAVKIVLPIQQSNISDLPGIVKEVLSAHVAFA